MLRLWKNIPHVLSISFFKISLKMDDCFSEWGDCYFVLLINVAVRFRSCLMAYVMLSELQREVYCIVSRAGNY